VTNAFLGHLIDATPAAHNQDHLRIVIEMNPKIPDRTACLLGASPDPRPMLVESATRLRTAGATWLVVPCNTARGFSSEISADCGVPVVDWISVAVEALPDGARVGVLVTQGTLATGDIYRRHRGERALGYKHE
jgi:aspartate racemase